MQSNSPERCFCCFNWRLERSGETPDNRNEHFELYERQAIQCGFAWNHSYDGP